MQADTSATEHPLVGNTIAGKYKIVRLLGEGGMGCVYLGEQQLGTTVRKVAVKTLHKHLSHDASIKARFQREVGTVAALEHPNTIQVFDFGAMEDGTLYIVMEFVQGRSVADILEKDGPMPPERVENILRQVVGSLEEAHGHGIVHRDLKPDNVVLCERAGQKDWVEVLDFGIAKRSSEHDPNEAKLTQQGMVLGTPPYMSPEQFTGQPVDVRSDIYALGVMAYEMLTGRLPWEANTAWEWASKHMTEVPTPLERQPLGAHVPEKMRHAITRALAKNKDERFASVREFFDAFATGAAPMTTGPQQQAGTAILSGNAAGAASGPSPRVKTEIGAPPPGLGGGYGAPPPGAGPMNAIGGGMGGIAPGPQPPVMVPAGPVHSGPKKGGSPVLFIALGGLALLLFLGAGVALSMRSKPAPVPTAMPDLTASATASAPASIAHVDEPPPAVVSATPLDTSGAKIPPAPNTGGGGKPATKPSSSAAPVPTPKSVKADPPECARARDAKAQNRSPKIVAALEQQCRNAGGTP